ncbi:hypothetical protein [Actinomadura madurae]|uniref:hypothetical protein n=1 Tax=Actinomadura madurae TaxID=1993 RepID=UPI002026D132|nr:hypothetical protein [Actinomadura madurae]MCP9951025.1 hypothetical protein [Actinomadura madurae]MCP9967807.1 hypothetical protein [Actinomadura madurae]MCP9980262.1 hypothetical protein [Actinomadura madurae]MCQ0016473.1 hypothetical protein [Actinomadura madurae]URM96571.1 hypothetical protein LUW76_20780 [Actinomadura madurae]
MAYLADYAACLDADIRTSRSAPSSPRSTEPAATTRTEPESSSYRGTAAPKPIGIGVGAPAGLGVATGRVHGYSPEAERGDA